MTHPNAALALALLVDATAETARSAGHAARHQRADEERQRIQRADEARRRQVREAFSTAMVRLVLLAPVWLFLCFIILANNYLENTFAAGSYSVTTWTFVLAIGACLVIDLTIARGSETWFVAGAAFGFALSTWYTVSASGLTGLPVDVSMFWLTGFFAAAAYLTSALHAKQNRQ